MRETTQMLILIRIRAARAQEAALRSHTLAAIASDYAHKEHNES
jgi:hypothetical protein